jgi:hypothetical protein
MILKSFGLGFVIWFLGTLLFRFAGHYFLYPDPTAKLILFIAWPIVCAVVAWLALGVLKEAAIDRGEAAIGLAAPGMLLDALATLNFQTVFPNIDPELAQDFGALMLLGYAAIIITGLMVTRIDPKDEAL